MVLQSPSALEAMHKNMFYCASYVLFHFLHYIKHMMSSFFWHLCFRMPFQAGRTGEACTTGSLHSSLTLSMPFISTASDKQTGYATGRVQALSCRTLKDSGTFLQDQMSRLFLYLSFVCFVLVGLFCTSFPMDSHVALLTEACVPI